MIYGKEILAYQNFNLMDDSFRSQNGKKNDFYPYFEFILKGNEKDLLARF